MNKGSNIQNDSFFCITPTWNGIKRNFSLNQLPLNKINMITFVSGCNINTPCIPIARMLFCLISVLPIVYNEPTHPIKPLRGNIRCHTTPNSSHNQYKHTCTTSAPFASIVCRTDVVCPITHNCVGSLEQTPQNRPYFLLIIGRLTCIVYP